MAEDVKPLPAEEIRTRKRMRKAEAQKSRKGSRRQNLDGPDKDIISADVAEKRKLALGLRKQRATYADIAKAMGLSTPMVAWRYVQDAIADIPMEVAAEVKQIEIEDCRADLFRINQRLEEERDSGKKITVRALVVALGAKVKLREQLARYLGLYAPVRNEHTGKDGAPLTLTMTDIQGMTDDQLERAISNASRGSSSSGAGAGSPSSSPRASRQPH